MIRPTLLFLILFPLIAAAADPPGVQTSDANIRHSFLVCGNTTALIGEDGAVLRSIPYATRDGFVLPNGNLLLAVNKSKEFPGGGIVELTPDGKVAFSWKGTQSEVNSVQEVAGGHLVTTEAGPKPRLLEIDRTGKTIVEFPLTCQNKDTHMETRMTRKLPSGNYLAPHLLDKAVREYTPEGKVARELKTPTDPKDSWPFTAIRLENGNTLITCTHGNLVIEVDRDGKETWRLSNADLPTPLLSDPCGAQRLASGNTVITSYGAAKPDAVKMLEVTPDKKVVWTYKSNLPHGVHEFQILTTNGQPEPTAMK